MNTHVLFSESIYGGAIFRKWCLNSVNKTWKYHRSYELYSLDFICYSWGSPYSEIDWLLTSVYASDGLLAFLEIEWLGSTWYTIHYPHDIMLSPSLSKSQLWLLIPDSLRSQATGSYGFGYARYICLCFQRKIVFIYHHPCIEKNTKNVNTFVGFIKQSSA